MAIDMKMFGAPYRRQVEKYGGLLTAEESVITVATTVTAIVGADPERVSLTLINLSSNTLSVSPQTSVSLTRGIILEANGGALVLDSELDGILPALNWFGIANLAAATVYRLSQSRIGVSTP